MSVCFWKGQTKDCLRTWELLEGRKEACWMLICHSWEMQTATNHWSVPLSKFFCSLYPIFFQSIVIYHLLKPLSCFSFPPCLCLYPVCVAYALPMCRWVAKDSCCCSLWLRGGILCPAAGKWSRWGAQALWLPQKCFHSSWDRGMTGKQLFHRPEMPVEPLCVYRWAWSTGSPRAMSLQLPRHLISAFPVEETLT